MTPIARGRRLRRLGVDAPNPVERLQGGAMHVLSHVPPLPGPGQPGAGRRSEASDSPQNCAPGAQGARVPGAVGVFGPSVPLRRALPRAARGRERRSGLPGLRGARRGRPTGASAAGCPCRARGRSAPVPTRTPPATSPRWPPPRGKEPVPFLGATQNPYRVLHWPPSRGVRGPPGAGTDASAAGMAPTASSRRPRYRRAPVRNERRWPVDGPPPRYAPPGTPLSPPVRALRGVSEGPSRGCKGGDQVARVSERGDVGEHAALAHAPRHRQRHAVPFQGPPRRRVPGVICPVNGEPGPGWRPERRSQRRRRGVKGAAGLGNSPIEIVTPLGEGPRGGSERSPGDLRGGTPGGEPPPDVKRGDPAVADPLAGVNSRPRTDRESPENGFWNSALPLAGGCSPSSRYGRHTHPGGALPGATGASSGSGGVRQRVEG